MPSHIATAWRIDDPCDMDPSVTIDSAIQERLEILTAAAGTAYVRTRRPQPFGTSASIIMLVLEDGRTAVAKLARPELPARRVAVERHLLGRLGPTMGLPVPQLIATAGNDLLIEALAPDPVPGDEEVLDAIQRVHRACGSIEDPGPLEAWGAGTARRARPHRRRADRTARRTAGFLLHLPEVHRKQWTERLGRLASSLEVDAETVDRLPRDTIIHGDLHPGQIARRDRDIVLLDWQQAAIGSPAVDLVRWIAEAGLCPQVAERRLDAARIDCGGLDPAVAIAAVARCTLAGLVSGFGGRSPGSLEPWESEIIARALRPGAWLDALLSR